ncbi:MAG: hypothetical protein K5979_01785 [Ruminococcus sp.]|nr:hypothetical protein [Ruminococcus sp.]
MKKNDLDILKNADDDIIEELVPFTNDNEETKKRVFEMSEKKYNSKMEKAGRSTGNSNDTMTFGVEKYSRPKWYKPLCTAAAIVLLLGGAGTVAVMNNNFSAGRGQSTQVEEGQVSEEPTEAVTEEATEAPTEVSAMLSEDEMKALFEEYSAVYDGWVQVNFYENFAPDGEAINFWVYGETYADINSDYYSRIGAKIEGDAVYYPITYTKLNKEHYGSISELKEYLGQYMTPDCEIMTYIDKIEDLSDFNDGDTIRNSPDETIPDVIEYNGELYAEKRELSFYDDSNNPPEVISNRSYEVSENSFEWERIQKRTIDAHTYIDAENYTFRKCDDGRWRISKGRFFGSEYDDTIDYTNRKGSLLNEKNGNAVDYFMTKDTTAAEDIENTTTV